MAVPPLLAVFYTARVLRVSPGGRWEVVKNHWPIALAMGFGSYVAGSRADGGLLGGIAAAVTGVGIDMMLYAVLVLLCRSDLKTAAPTSVLIMAAASLVGIVTNAALASSYRAVA